MGKTLRRTPTSRGQKVSSFEADGMRQGEPMPKDKRRNNRRDRKAVRQDLRRATLY